MVATDICTWINSVMTIIAKPQLSDPRLSKPLIILTRGANKCRTKVQTVTMWPVCACAVNLHCTSRSCLMRTSYCVPTKSSSNAQEMQGKCSFNPKWRLKCLISLCTAWSVHVRAMGTWDTSCLTRIWHKKLKNWWFFYTEIVSCEYMYVYH